MGEMANRLVRQVMALVEHVESLARIGQDGAAAQGQVSQDQVVVGDDHIDLGHPFARLVEGALLEVRAMSVGALAVIGGELRPMRVVDRLRPAVAVAVPAVAGQAFDHLVEQLAAGLVDVDVETVIGEQLRRRALRLAFLQQHVELGQAQVAPAALGQGEAEGQPAVAQQVGKILVDDLLLQGDGRGGYHQALATGLGAGDRRQAVGHGLAGTGSGLHRDHRRLALAVPLLVLLDRAEGLGHFGDHQALAIARLQLLGFEKAGVGTLDLGLEFGAEHGIPGPGAQRKANPPARHSWINFQWFDRAAMITRFVTTASGDRRMTPYALVYALHVLAALVWVGGMFFAWTILRPAAVAALEAPARLGLWLEVFRRFFHWVWAAVILLPISGVGMLHLSFNGFAGAPRYVQVMMGLYVAMLALFLRVQALQVPELRRAVQAQDWPAGGQALGKIRRTVGFNLLLGLLLIALVAARPSL